MQPRIAHRYVAEISLDGAQAITTPALAIDWTPAVEWSHFQEVRRGAASVTSAPGPTLVQPRWNQASGPPYVAALEVSPCNHAAGQPHEVGLEFLADPVRRAVSSLVEAGRVAEGARYTWRVCAFESVPANADATVRDPFTVDEAAETEDTLRTRRLADLLRNTEHHAAHGGAARADRATAELPVIISRRALAEASGAATAAGELEAGGILLGRLSRNAESSDLIVEITAQVPASEAIADDASLRFTPQTWAAVHAAIRLRRARERIVGWWHSHPQKVWPCHACPPERRAHCPSNRAFFSSMDVAFHRTAFQAPVNVALLFSFHEAPQPRHDLFGWWQGLITARDYYVAEEH